MKAAIHVAYNIRIGRSEDGGKTARSGLAKVAIRLD